VTEHFWSLLLVPGMLCLSMLPCHPYLLVITACRGVATGWTGVDMSTPLLPEVVPEIDANPVSFYSGGGGLGSVMVWSLIHPSLPYVRFKVTILEFAYGGFAPPP